NLVSTRPRFQSRIMHAGGKRRSGRHSTYVSSRKLRIRPSRRGVIRHCEWIERILDRYANAFGTYARRISCIREYVGGKFYRLEAAVPEPADRLEVGKELHILIANFAVQ